MRVIVFFDLPTTTYEERRAYTKFRKNLIKDGFLMLQESVYCKLALNQTAAEMISKHVKEYKPDDGVVQMLVLTEKQFSKMEYIIGDYTGNVLDSDDRLVVL
jgi:CRISPR-associated protein Cas2